MLFSQESGVLHGQLPLLWERGRGEGGHGCRRLCCPVVVSLGGCGGRRRARTSSLAPLRTWVVLLVCRLGLPLHGACFVGMESVSSNMQRQGIKARLHVPFCYISLQNCCPFPRFLLVWRRAKPLLTHLLLAVTSGRLRGVTSPTFSFWHVFQFRFFFMVNETE